METPAAKRRIPMLYSLVFFLAAALAFVMLYTDKNLQTDFGSVSPYYVHWYGVLLIGLANLAGAVYLVVRPSRRAAWIGVVGASLLTVAVLAVILTYMQVGFASAGDFANYLFGVTYYGGDVRYLYDALLAAEIGAAAAGGAVLALTRETPQEGSPAGRSKGTST